MVGEKRQREEDETDDRNNGNRSTHDESKSQQDHHPQNGAPHYSHDNSSGTPGSTNGTPGGNVSGGNANLDALYIGDLQWVRSPSFYGNRSSHICASSGPPMKTCDKWPSNWASISTTRISPSQSIRSTGRARGESHICAIFFLHSSSFVSIAYVECHSYENALAIKNWFDNKYVPPCFPETLTYAKPAANSKIATQQLTSRAPRKAIPSALFPKVDHFVRIRAFLVIIYP